jgi:hypothetical protein
LDRGFHRHFTSIPGEDNSERGELTGWPGDATFLEYLHLNKYKEAKQIAYVIGNQTPGR